MMNKKGQEIAQKFTDVMLTSCITINLLLMLLSVTLSDWNLFKIASASAGLLVLSKVYRYYEKKEE